MARNLDRVLHLVQVGYDDSVFAENAASDTLRRQLWYGEELAHQRPGSRMSVVMFTAKRQARRFARGNVVFVPIYAPQRAGLVRLFPQLVALHRERPIDAIATQTIHEDAWISLLFGHLHGVGVIGQVHYDVFSPFAQQEILGSSSLGRLRNVMGMRLIRRLHAVRVVGRRTGECMRVKKLHDNVHVLPVPVTMLASTEGVMSQRSRPERRVSFVGRLVPAKNLTDWLRVAALVAAHDEAAEFEVVGDGPLRQELERLAERLGIAARVRFRGLVAYEELPVVYRSMCVFLLTSHYEGFGRVVVESYAHGVPVVATQISGVEDIVDDRETGFLHASGDVEGMAASVLRLLHDDQLRTRMGRVGRDLVRVRFDPKQLSRQWVALLVSAVREVGRW